MNGNSLPANAGSLNASSLVNGTNTLSASDILNALETIQNPRTDNNLRRSATEYLEQLRADDSQAAQYGYTLGSDPRQAVLVRHFGLSLLEHVVRHRWHELGEELSTNVRKSIIELGQSTTQDGPQLLRNKIAELWIELAKRSWALDWFDMDGILRQIWLRDAVSKQFVLMVLENLSEDVFVREDPGAVLRGKDLSTALVDIFSSTSEHTGDIKIGQQTYAVRAGDEGWLSRINTFLAECLQNDLSSQQVRTCITKVLATLRSAFCWVMTTSIANSGCLSSICELLSRHDPDLLMAAIETLLSLYGRARLEDEDIEILVYPMCHPDNASILSRLFAWSVVGIQEVDSPNYVISKKLSELLSQVADWITHTPPPEIISIDFSQFFALMVSAAQHQSLIVSIPIVHSWGKLLAQSYWRKSPAVASCTGALLQFACQRTIQYDLLPEDTDEPAVLFVHEELELFPERQGFFLNYRRLSCQIIELVTYSHLNEAMPHIISQVDEMLNKIQHSELSFNPAAYSKSSMAILHADAQFSIVESAFRGFSAWKSAHRDDQSTAETQLQESTSSSIRTWSIDLLSKRTFKDPLIKQRVIKAAVEISNKALKDDRDFALKVLEHILSALIPNQPDATTYAEAVDDLHLYATSELMRLAAHHADYFITFYEQLESSIKETNARGDLHESTLIALSASLFLVLQRASGIDPDVRRDRLSLFLEAIRQGWEDPQVRNGLSSFESFVEMQAFDRVAPYMASIDAANLSEWPTVPLDADGASLRDEMKTRTTLQPLKRTRVMLQVSTDKLSHSDPAYHLACELWTPILPALLHGVLEIVSYNHRLHDATAWPNLPPEMQSIAKKILQDRYWQSGISEGSMTDFHTKIKSSKNTLEGFASSVRGRIRQNLENSYSILHNLGKLSDTFFNIPRMPEMLAETLLETSRSLSPHHYSVLLNMMIKLVDDCPPRYRQSFFPPVLGKFMSVLDNKCWDEWNKLEARKSANAKDDELSDEMRDDSILRNFTYKAVNMVMLWIDPQRDAKIGPKRHHSNGAGQSVPINASDTGASLSIRAVVLSNIPIIGPLLVFCTHGLGYKDTKSCTGLIRTLRWIVPAYAAEPLVSSAAAAEVIEFISTETFKAAIVALTDGHFVDQQKDLANLIATIWIAYGITTHIAATEQRPAYDRLPLTPAPRNLLLSLPGMTQQKVDSAGGQLSLEGGINGSSKHQRAQILSLLGNLRGVRLSELGKIDTSQQKSKLMQKYLQRESMGMQRLEDGVQPSNIEGEGLDLGGVPEMFGAS